MFCLPSSDQRAQIAPLALPPPPPQLVVARTEGGALIGGYNPRGFIGIGEDRDAIAAFLFTWPDGNTAQRPIKLPKTGGPGLAVVDRGGIKFGAEGLTIPLSPEAPRSAKCRRVAGVICSYTQCWLRRSAGG